MYPGGGTITEALGFTNPCCLAPSPKPKLAAPVGGVVKDAVLGPPVNCCTMARKLAVSVLSSVVGVLLEALDRFRTGFETRPSGLKLLVLLLGAAAEADAVAVVVTTVASCWEAAAWS